MHTDRDIQICLLRPLHVVRADGTVVAPDEWRTGKTMDLLRLLALNEGRPVRQDSLVDRLWPDVNVQRGRGSLRTASSQLRRALRAKCVVRHPEGLVLSGVTVDVDAFRKAAQRAALAARDGQHARVLEAAREALGLYVDDFRAFQDDSDWAIAERQHLARIRLELLCDAAVSAEAMHNYREAADLASLAIRVDATSEIAHRVLMSSHAELGNVAHALRAFESYRQQLADELGADPSPQTQELHLRLLRGNSA